MIDNDDELQDAVEIVNQNIQEIQDYLDQDPHPQGKIRFPRRFIRTAGHFRYQLLFIDDYNVRDNLAYSLILTDIHRWLLIRTTIYGVAKEMIIKSGIALLGSICETLAVTGTRGIIGRRHSFCERCNRMVNKGIISERICEELVWLWEVRSAIHIYEIDHSEYAKYTLNDYNRAVIAMRELRKVLKEYHS